MFIPIIRRHILAFLVGVLLVSCSQITTSPDTSASAEREVLGIGTIDIVMPDSVGTDIQTTSFESGYVNIPSELEFTATPVTQLTFGTANGVAGRYLLTRVRLRNVSDRTLDNLTLLGISLAGADQSLTPFSRVQTIIGSFVDDANALYQIKPSQPISIDGITNASFVAFAESDLDSDLRNTLNNIPGANIAAVLPYGFRAGDVTAGQEVAVDIGFFIPDGNPVGRFVFRFVAVTDSIERIAQGIDEIDTDGNQDPNVDRGYAAVRARFGNPAANKTLVLTGPFAREVAQGDIDQNIFTLLPDIRIAGAAGSPLATLFDSGSAAVAQVSSAGQSQPANVSALSELRSTTVEPAASSRGSVTYAWTVAGSGTCVLELGYDQPSQTIDPCNGNQTYTHSYDDWQNYYFAELTVTDGDGFNETRVHSFLSDNAYQLLRLTNEVRMQPQVCQGTPLPAAPPLRWDTRLENAALGHSQDMAARNFYGHANPEGLNSGDRIRAAGYDWIQAGENIARSSSSGDYSRFLASWLASTTGHCESIMNPNFADLGVGYAFDSTPAPDPPVSQWHIYTQNFGRHR